MDENSQIPQVPLNSALAAQSPLWLHRLFLGITGLVIGQIFLLVQTVILMLVFLADRGDKPRDWIIYWLPQGGIDTAIYWFSAIYLIAAAPITDTSRQFSVTRTILLWFGCAYVLLRCLPGVLHIPGRFSPAVFAPPLQIGAVAGLFLHLMYIARKAEDDYLARHLPMALALTCLSLVFDMVMQLRLRGLNAFDVQVVLKVAATVYSLHLMLRLRKLLAAVLHPASSETPAPPPA